MRRRGRRPRKAKPGFLARMADLPSIHHRPKVIETRSRIGHWEMDLMALHRSSGRLITVVERKSGFLLTAKIACKQSHVVMRGIIKLFKGIDPAVVQTMTFDNGTEFYYYNMLVQKLGVKVYFADAYSPWQRDSNENTNGLLRQYFLKIVNYGSISHHAVRQAQGQINHRPRLRHNFQTPAAILAKHQKIEFRL